MRNQKKILQIQGFGEGGSAVHTANLSKFLIENGYDVHIACPNGEYAEELSKEGICVHRIDLSGKYDFKSIFTIAKIIEQNRIDLVHTHCRNADFAGLVACGWNPKIKKIVTLHGWLGNETGLMNDKFELNPFIHTTLIHIFADQVIAISFAVKEHAITKYKIPAEKISVVYNGTDESLYQLNQKKNFRISLREELKIPQTAVVISHVANLYPSKRHDLFLEAAQKILNEKNNDEIYFLVVGDGPQRDELLRLAEELCITDRIVFLGHRNDVPRLLLGSDLAVVCSRWEGFGRGVVEAFAAEIPVVAINVGAISELMNNELSPLLIPEPNSCLLASKIISILSDEDIRKKYGKAGRRNFEKNYTNQKFSDSTISIIDKLLF
jgi:glycosyltransferase involved in cell wall biosynthesis